MRWMGWGCWISRCIRQGLRRPGASAALSAAREERAQATVEAAVLLPVFLTLLLLAVQPVCVLYTRAVMESAAAETARLMVTAEGETDESIRAFALRRLAAVPDISIFHAGGPLAWDIEMQAASSGDGEVNGQGDVEMSVRAGYDGRPSWLEGDYGTWTQRWD